MDQKAVSETTKWEIIDVKDGPRISNREAASRLSISENCIRNNLRTFKTTGSIQRRPSSRS